MCGLQVSRDILYDVTWAGRPFSGDTVMRLKQGKKWRFMFQSAWSCLEVNMEGWGKAQAYLADWSPGYPITGTKTKQAKQKNQDSKGKKKKLKISTFQIPVLPFQSLSHINMLNWQWLCLKLHDLSLPGLSHSTMAVTQRQWHFQAFAGSCLGKKIRTGCPPFHLHMGTVTLVLSTQRARYSALCWVPRHHSIR